ncbi:hypothetical conserved protein [Candidatus Nitrosoglobus terrae]|uniref:Hypothetical conserved protein n=1 Tax=Candidatus Nitrosoglobus terrae TaxID=1630141 RepID=A0A1Q2SLX3_9GAMM|nr:DUF4139 domain-containing protein [Candidatus Nitrosoglobus terrae]BAW80138.1 hypothetical conserved protein [Candidatus Nitrosoglobus terrae]
MDQYYNPILLTTCQQTLLIKALILSMLLSSTIAWGNEEIQTTQADQKAVSITIYNNNLALVRDQRRIVLKKGNNTLAFTDVSTEIQPETALLRNLSRPKNFFVIEQNYEFDLLTAQNLLEKYVGQKVGVRYHHPTTGEQTIKEAILLAANPEIILQFKDHIEAGIPLNRITYPQTPQNLRTNPALVSQINTTFTGPQTLELNYLTRGLSWKADYIAQLNEAENHFDLNSWITLTNQSGIAYKGAHLQFMAGNIHQVTPFAKYARPQAREAITLANEAPTVQEEALLDYHLYSLAQATTINNNQTKQITLFNARNIPIQKSYEIHDHISCTQDNPTYPTVFNLPVAIFLRFDNSKENKLGLPLPPGIVRFYKQNLAHDFQFVGEDIMIHKDDYAEFKIGQAFDVTAIKQRTRYQKLSYNTFESTFEIKIQNITKIPVVVKITELIPDNCHVLAENYPHQQKTANAAVWQLAIPPEKRTTLIINFEAEKKPILER